MIEKLAHWITVPAKARPTGRREKMQYILVNGQPEKTDDLLRWGQWLQNSSNERIVQQDKISIDGQTLSVSTVFLGLDHNHSPVSTVPILWETLADEFAVDGSVEEDAYIERYATREEAMAGHLRICECIRQKKPFIE